MGTSLSKQAALDAARLHFPYFLESRKQAQALEAWLYGEQYAHSEDMDPTDRFYGRAYAPDPRQVTAEYENLRSLSSNNFAGLVVKSLSQMCHIEGISSPDSTGTLPVWDTLRRNRWASKQNALHFEAIGLGLAYGIVVNGEDPLTGDPMARMGTRSATEMLAFYQDDDDEWPMFAIEAQPLDIKDEVTGMTASGWSVKLWDAGVIHHMECRTELTAEKDGWHYISSEEHGVPVPPVAQLSNRSTLSGKVYGEIEPILPLLRRLDQGMFDRLIVQRFGAWQVRYIAGMAKPVNKEEAEAQKIRLSSEDILISTSHETKFGVLPGGDIANQTNVTDADLRILSAIAQIPPHHLLGQASNLQAEALAAATEGLMRKAFEFKLNAAEFHEQMARLAAMVEGDLDTARAWDLRVRWRDESSGSLSQAADALSKLAQGLGIPVEMLWERVPGWTDDDVQRAKELVESGQVDAILQKLMGETPDAPETEDPAAEDPQTDAEAQ